MPGRWRLLFHLWKFLTNYSNFFGYKTATMMVGEPSAKNFLFVYNFRPKIWYQHAVFLRSTTIMEVPCWKEPFSLIAGDVLMSTLSAGGGKLRLKYLPTAFPYKTCLKLIQILSFIIDWPSYIETFHKPVRVCVCVCLIQPESYYTQKCCLFS